MKSRGESNLCKLLLLQKSSSGLLHKVNCQLIHWWGKIECFVAHNTIHITNPSDLINMVWMVQSKQCLESPGLPHITSIYVKGLCMLAHWFGILQSLFLLKSFPYLTAYKSMHEHNQTGWMCIYIKLMCCLCKSPNICQLFIFTWSTLWKIVWKMWF